MLRNIVGRLIHGIPPQPATEASEPDRPGRYVCESDFPAEQIDAMIESGELVEWRSDPDGLAWYQRASQINAIAAGDGFDNWDTDPTELSYDEILVLFNRCESAKAAGDDDAGQVERHWGDDLDDDEGVGQ